MTTKPRSNLRRKSEASKGARATRVTRIPRWTGFAGKTLWDWLQLLVIPLALVAIAFGFDYFQGERDQQREDRRAARERGIAADGRREDALRAYLQQMSGLMLERNLRTSRPGSEVQAVARAFTLTVLRRLDPSRKAVVVRFLAQAGLIGSELSAWPRILDFRHPHPRLPARMPPPKIDLNGADLRDAPLRRIDLAANSLEGADLRGADFRQAYLIATKFDRADLRNADFGGAAMGEGIVVGRPTSFFGACVTGARFAYADMSGSDFGAYGWNVNLSHANLRGADLSGARLHQVKLDGTNLRRITLPYWSGRGERFPLVRRRDASCP
jgi:uncharacterized protein YjbI with pentapeptide repeats